MNLEPAKYLSDLVGVINDSARTAGASGLFLLLTGLYLAVTVFSTTDEGLLRETVGELS